MNVVVGYVSETREPFASFLPVGSLLIHAVLSAAGYQSLVVNFSKMKAPDRLALLQRHSPRLIFLTVFTHNYHQTLRLADRVKKVLPGCIIVLGGPHATFSWKELLVNSPVIDAVVRGEGEAPCAAVATAVADGGPLYGIPGVATREDAGKDVALAPVAENLDVLPLAGAYADRSVGVDLRRQLEFIITSRGCPAACAFCSSPAFWGRSIRYRSARSVVDEIRFLRDRYGLIYFSFRDDTFTCDRTRVIEICRMLIEERIFIVWNCQSRVNAVDAEVLQWMRRAGCEAIQYGVESGSPRVLKRLAKGVTLEQVHRAGRLTREAGIGLSVYFITGVPGETDSDVQETLALISSLRPDDGQVSPLVYYPGTKLYQDAVARGDACSDMFQGTQESFPVRNDPFVAKSMKQIVRRLNETGRRHALAEKDFLDLRERFGYCHVGNVMAGEWLKDRGRFTEAESLFVEITEREPDNPWGWLSLGELYADEGDADGAIRKFIRMAEIVPQHAPAYVALGELYEMTGRRRKADAAFAHAAQLDPFGEGSR